MHACRTVYSRSCVCFSSDHSFCSRICLSIAASSWLNHLLAVGASAIEPVDFSPTGTLHQFYAVVVGMQYVLSGWLPKTILPFSRLQLVRDHIQSAVLERGIVALTPPNVPIGGSARLQLVRECVFMFSSSAYMYSLELIC